MAFFVAFVTLAVMATMCASERDRVTLVAASLVLPVRQAVYVGRGGDYARIWEITEREGLFIPLDFSSYPIRVTAPFDARRIAAVRSRSPATALDEGGYFVSAGPAEAHHGRECDALGAALLQRLNFFQPEVRGHLRVC